MNKPSKTLLQKWYKKLESKGFKDIEVFDDKHERLKTWDSFYFLPQSRQKTMQELAAKAAYYRHCLQFGTNHKFKLAMHRRIWELHTAGKGHSTISRETKIPIKRLRKILNEYKALMKEWIKHEQSY